MVDRTEIERRRVYTQQRWQALQTVASGKFSLLNEIGLRSCIYVTGSMARDEATEGSDLDLFVIDRLDEDAEALNLIETSHLMARLDEARQDARFRPFSRGGEFVRTQSFQSLMELIGDPRDDAENAFTARILLMLNSRPLLNGGAYELARRKVLDAYWQSGAPHAEFRPVMLINDIRRWWGVLCLNFERYNKPVKVDEYTSRSGTERRINNLKLRYARMMAAYTPLVRLVALSDPSGTVQREAAERALCETPIERLEQLEFAADQTGEVRHLAEVVLDQYNAYLKFMNSSKEDMAKRVSQDGEWHPIKVESYRFHENFVGLFKAAGEGKSLYDYCIV